jgi:Tol biopolymer transport system component
LFEATGTWSLDGKKIVFQRQMGVPRNQQLWIMNADGTDETRLTFPPDHPDPSINVFPNWGEIWVRGCHQPQ